MPDLVFVILGWCAGGFINGVAGFGAAMIAMPLVAPFVDFSVAVPACVLIVLTLNCQVVWAFRHDIQWQYVREICVGAIPGAVLSIYVLKLVDENTLKAAMGGFIACYALWSLAGEKQSRRVIHTGWGYVAGTLSSALGMAFGFNGPPLAAYVAYSRCPARAVKGTLGAGFIITGVCIVAAKAATGEITQPVFVNFAAAAPAVLVGSKLGIWFSSSINEYSYRKILFVALAAMGVRIVWSALPS